VRSDAGTPLQVTIPELGKPAVAHIWRAQVGRVPLFLLDTNVAENEPAERDITDQLYGGDAEMRIRQEIVPRHRRRPCPRGHGDRPRRLPHERGTFCVPGARTHAPVDAETPADVRGGA
jgi:hypothetical protein